jgi:hypothetical protein
MVFRIVAGVVAGVVAEVVARVVAGGDEVYQHHSSAPSRRWRTLVANEGARPGLFE